MPSIGLIQGANSLNPTRDAFQQKTAELDAGHKAEAANARAEQDRKDNDIHQVIKYAADGLTNEAKYLAQQKGIQLPEEIFNDSAFAKGLSLSKDIYPNDPEAAQRYAMSFRSSQGDLATRHQAALQAGGKPVSSDDREFNNYVRKAEWDIKNKPSSGDSGFTLAPGQVRYDASGNQIAISPQKEQPDQNKFINVGGVAYRIEEGGNLTPVTQPQPNMGAFEAGETAYNEALKYNAAIAITGGDPIDPELQRQKKIQEYNSFLAQQSPQPSVPSSGLIGTNSQNQPSNPIQDPMAASRNAIQMQQSQIGANPYQRPDLAPQQQQTNIPPELPSGTIYVGTSNGFPVYQAPDGQRYIDDGTP